MCAINTHVLQISAFILIFRKIEQTIGHKHVYHRKAPREKRPSDQKAYIGAYTKNHFQFELTLWINIVVSKPE